MKQNEIRQRVRARYKALAEYSLNLAGFVLGASQLGEDVFEGSTVVLPTEYPNQDFERPDDGIWARFNWLSGDTQQVSFGSPGNRRFRETDTLIVQVFGPVDQGSGEVENEAQRVAAVFDALTYENVTYRPAKIVEVGREANWFQLNVEVSFFADDIR